MKWLRRGFAGVDENEEELDMDHIVGGERVGGANHGDHGNECTKGLHGRGVEDVSTCHQLQAEGIRPRQHGSWRSRGLAVSARGFPTANRVMKALVATCASRCLHVEAKIASFAYVSVVRKVRREEETAK